MIAFHDVSCRRGAAEVLTHVTFEVPQGETLAVVGRSGAGKSTILKLINRMLTPSAGRVELNGRDVAAWDPFVLRRHTGYVLQDVGLFPHMSIARNVAVVPTLMGWAADRIGARVTELLELVGLPASRFADRLPHELSGGQRQRVGVARALAADPPVILMDEPFGSLDPVTRVELHREFRRIQAHVRKTVVIVTHDMREAFALADRVAVLDDGRLAAIARREGLQASSEPSVRMLLDAAFE